MMLKDVFWDGLVNPSIKVLQEQHYSPDLIGDEFQCEDFLAMKFIPRMFYYF